MALGTYSLPFLQPPMPTASQQHCISTRTLFEDFERIMLVGADTVPSLQREKGSMAKSRRGALTLW